LCACTAEQKLLEDLHDRFSREHKNMEDYGLPKPQSIQSEFERELNLVEDQNYYRMWLNQLNLECPNTDEMNSAFDIISSAISDIKNDDKVKLFLIRGIGGAGKTQFAKKVNII
jgi:tRNA uridine 5-carbamoylmethylation protein Kti12